LFGEDQARYVVTVRKADEAAFLAAAKAAGVVAAKIGVTGGEELAVNGAAISLATLRQVNEEPLPAFMG
jgi:phosphoribosylformylglycinamidine synthase